MKNSNYLLFNSQNFTGTCMHTEWLPSPETYEVLELGGISRDFLNLKLKNFDSIGSISRKIIGT